MERWTLEMIREHAKTAPRPVYRAVDVDCFGELVLVVEDRPGLMSMSKPNKDGKHIPYQVTLVLPRKVWATQHCG